MADDLQLARRTWFKALKLVLPQEIVSLWVGRRSRPFPVILLGRTKLVPLSASSARSRDDGVA